MLNSLGCPEHVGEPQLDEADAPLLDGPEHVVALALHRTSFACRRTPPFPGGPGNPEAPAAVGANHRGRRRAPVIWIDASPAPGRRAAQHRRGRPGGERGAGARRPRRRRGGRGRPLRGARARHPRLPARGPPPQAGLRGRQRGRPGEGGGGHPRLRHRGRFRGGRTRRAGAGQRGRRLRPGPGGRRLPQAVPPQLRRVRRAALLRGRDRAADALPRGRGLGGRLDLRGRVVRRTGRWPTPAGPAPTWW